MKLILAVGAIGITASAVGWSIRQPHEPGIRQAQTGRVELPALSATDAGLHRGGAITPVAAARTGSVPVSAALAPLVPARSTEERAREGALKAGHDVWYFADWDGNGVLTGGDFLAFVAAYQGRESGADLNRDGTLDTADIAEFLRQYGERRGRSIHAC